MKISNFKPTAFQNDGEPILATIDVTTNLLFFKRTVTREIVRAAGGTYWSFTDNGDFAPNPVYNMERGWVVKNKSNNTN